MTRVIWAGLVVCAAGAGCGGPQFYPAPPEHFPPPAVVGGVNVRFIDERPDWEKKPFKGTVCLYHLGKAHPDAWVQLAEETSAVVESLPQKPERVDVVVSSFQLVRSGEPLRKYHDISTASNPNPSGIQSQALRGGGSDARDPTAGPGGQSATDGPPNQLEMALAPKDDPRRLLTEHPAGVSCSIRATINLVYPGGAEKAIPVKTIFRAPNDGDSGYYGQAIDNSARGAVIDFGRQFRAALGLTVQ
jgi:hypothetical protein